MIFYNISLETSGHLEYTIYERRDKKPLAFLYFANPKKLLLTRGNQMAKNLTPTEYADKLILRMSNAVPDWERGVEGVTEAPTAKAAKAVDKWATNIINSKGKFVRGLNRVSLQDWKDVTLGKGRDRIASGVEAARSKIEAFAAEFLPFQDGVRQKVLAMPSTTMEQNIARAVAMMKGTHEFIRKS